MDVIQKRTFPETCRTERHSGLGKRFNRQAAAWQRSKVRGQSSSKELWRETFKYKSVFHHVRTTVRDEGARDEGTRGRGGEGTRDESQEASRHAASAPVDQQEVGSATEKTMETSLQAHRRRAASP